MLWNFLNKNMIKEEWDIFFEQKITEISKRGNILDVGGGPGFQKNLKKFKHLFLGSNYRSFDIEGTGAQIVGDIHNIPIPNNSEDAVICNAVLEHVFDPIRAVREIYRILKPGGVLLIQIPSTYPYHGNKGYGGNPGYGDYWRFFEETIRYILKDFSYIEIVNQGGYFRAMVTFLPIRFLNKHTLDRISRFLDKIFKKKQKNITKGYYVYAIK